MRQRIGRPGKRAGTSPQFQLLAFAALALTGAAVLILLTSGTRASDMAALTARVGGDAAFCASRLLPRLTLPEPTPPTPGSVFSLAGVLKGQPATLTDGTVAPAATATTAVITPVANAARAQRISAIFDVSVGEGRLHVPPAFRAKALRMFPSLTGTSDAQRLSHLEKQSIVTVRNRHTYDMAYFNEVRRYRPNAEARLRPDDELEIARLYAGGATAEECDLCSVERTAEDVFGRKEGHAAYTAANVAKMSPWHSLVVARQHNPLAFDVASIEDLINQSAAWFETVVDRDPAQQYGNAICDIGKRASASQVHLHFQVWTTRSQFSGGFAKLHATAQSFGLQHGTSYWAAFIEAHAAAGLVVQIGSAYVFPHLTPAKEKEMIVLEPRRSASFGRAVALAMIAMRDEGGARAMSIGMALPSSPVATHINMPAMLRIIDRGNPLDPRSDTGGFEYFTSPYIGSDPYRVTEWLRRTVAKLGL